MTSKNSINQRNINLGFNMSWKIKLNLDLLKMTAAKIRGVEASEKASEIVDLYKNRKIPQYRTAKKILYELNDDLPRKQKLGLKHAKQLIKRNQKNNL